MKIDINLDELIGLVSKLELNSMILTKGVSTATYTSEHGETGKELVDIQFNPFYSENDFSNGQVDFGNNIKILRENRKLSQKQLADSVGVTQAMICQIEKNLRVPSLAVGYEIAKALDVKLDNLCKGA